MIPGVKERIPAEICLCKRRDVLLHTSVQSTEPTHQRLQQHPQASFWLSFSPRSPSLAHLPISQSLSLSRDEQASSLQRATEMWEHGHRQLQPPIIPTRQGRCWGPRQRFSSHRNYNIPEKDSDWPGLSPIPSLGQSL